MTRTTTLIICALLTLLPNSVRAQDAEAEAFLSGETGTGETDPNTQPADPDPQPADPNTQPTDPSAEAFLDGQDEAPEIADPEQERGIGREEPEDMRFWMVGVRWRMLMVPAWLLDAFYDFPNEAQAAPSVTVNQTVGIEFTTRKNRLSIIGAIWWADFRSDEFVANEAGETNDPEFIQSEFQTLMFTVDFVHSYMFTDWFGITYGAGLGVGIVIDNGLNRHEARPAGGDNWERCVAPDPKTSWCESNEDGWYHPEQYEFWRAVPWINIVLGLRFKPHRHVEINVDTAGPVGFLFGLRVNYIF